MMFATDQTLLALSPRVFNECAWAGQRRVSGTGTISGLTLTMTSSDVTLEAAGVGEGSVALIDDVPHEVLARTGANAAGLSRVRARESDGPIPPAPGAGKAVRIVTFAPQLASAHDRLLTAAGLEPGDESRIVNGAELAMLEAVWALAAIWAGARGIGDTMASERAAWFHREVGVLRSRLRVRLNTGEERTLTGLRLVRE